MYICTYIRMYDYILVSTRILMRKYRPKHHLHKYVLYAHLLLYVQCMYYYWSNPHRLII